MYTLAEFSHTAARVSYVLDPARMEKTDTAEKNTWYRSAPNATGWSGVMRHAPIIIHGGWTESADGRHQSYVSN
jgi:hypothetical protein